MALRRRRGVTRIAELVLATSMVVAVVLFVMFFTRPIRSAYLRETSDLRRLAYNVLDNLAEAGVFERVLGSALAGDVGWEGRLRFLVSSSMPPGVLFRMEVYSVSFDTGTGTVAFTRLDRGGVSNAELSVSFKEAESVYYTYVCTRDPDSMRGRVFYFVLVVGYAG
uniref:Uncharacterized protein n=1 Tax=Thermofilum pendens TaxID=2269 RepID=A0A7J3X8L4_THEPE